MTTYVLIVSMRSWLSKHVEENLRKAFGECVLILFCIFGGFFFTLLYFIGEIILFARPELSVFIVSRLFFGEDDNEYPGSPFGVASFIFLTLGVNLFALATIFVSFSWLTVVAKTQLSLDSWTTQLIDSGKKMFYLITIVFNIIAIGLTATGYYVAVLYSVGAAAALLMVLQLIARNMFINRLKEANTLSERNKVLRVVTKFTQVHLWILFFKTIPILL